ncbi:hypothetical protein C8D92_104105 [Tamilnaduibacter salinus]|uniref:Uncharacterized protein n=1 Tax=Tamilnaduibacter salinus TaxID=1484056 RepID=A0A2U1CX90_9GAMM|nr:hypothetical protein [Tamilnaduibacter salinus]PVY76874.1 hypothetical protein C8D92_104105 [Tamilnaduibacter salinus]
MFEGIEELPISEQLSRLVMPRGDWFDAGAIQKFLIQVIPEFERQGHRLPNADHLLSICRENQLIHYVTINQPPSGIRGLITESPQHAGIVELGRREVLENQRLALAAVVMLCADDWREQLRQQENPFEKTTVLESRLKEVWRMLRLASTRALQLIPPISMSLHSFHDALNSKLEIFDPREKNAWGRDVRDLHSLLRFVNYYLGGGKVYRRSPDSTPGEVGGVLEVSPVKTAPSDAGSEIEGESSSDTTLITWEPIAERRKSRHFQEGNSPEEMEHGPRLSETRRPIKVAQGGSPAQAAIRLKNRQVYQRRNAQVLPGRWSTLNQAELRQLGMALRSLDAQSDSRLVTAVWLMLITGRELEEILATRVVRKAKQIPEVLSSGTIYLIAERAEWVVRPLEPEDRRKIKSEWRGVLEHHEDRIQLPVPHSFWQEIGSYVAGKARGVQKRSAALFPKNDADRIEQRVRGFLREVNRRHNARLTLSRVAYQLTEELHRVSGDLIEANLITGRQPPFGASAALYYHHRYRQTLVDHYQTVTERWEGLMFEERWETSGRQRMLLDGTVGSDLVLRTDVVRSVFQALRKQVEYDRRLLGSEDGLRLFHNSLTDYALMMMFWLTGYRAVQDPLAQTHELNARRRWLMVADKTGDGYSHSRVVPVCTVLAEQLLSYNAHADWLRNRLNLVGRQSQGTAFFYLDEQLNEVQVRPQSMQKFLEWAYVLPLNLNRHWLRGALREQQVPGPHVDRFMGHWGMGQEPWGRHSGVDPWEFHQTLERALDGLAEILQLEVVEGLL